ncbi:Uncharacterized protein YR821_3261 [Yersinia ruckeri]|nr:hypothetical protein yruck0001_1040 [Yersinia ruckeri ATCC 29473]QTD78177.1 Uncharacterized protein YR821_3261 [Yersinia ruckeri]
MLKIIFYLFALFFFLFFLFRIVIYDVCRMGWAYLISEWPCFY